MTRRVALYGHRGARGLFPENTIAGFKGALAMGVDALELDVGVTADGVVVVSHDPALNPDLTRDPLGNWLPSRGPLLRDLASATLAAYDVGRIRPGTTYATRFPEQSAIDGARIPTLEAVFRCDPDIRAAVEMKTFPSHPNWTVSAEAMADAVMAVADGADAVARILVQSFDWRGLRHLRRTRPEVALSWLTCARTEAAALSWWDKKGLSGSVPGAVAAEGGPVWGPDHVSLDREMVEKAHALSLEVIPWTVNRPEDMASLIAWSVDGLITDRPDLAREVLSAHGMELPAPRLAASDGRRMLRAG